MDPIPADTVAAVRAATRPLVDGIVDEIRKARKAFDVMLRKAHDTLAALRVEVSDEATESSSPITLPNSSLETARLSLGSGKDAA